MSADSSTTTPDGWCHAIQADEVSSGEMCGVELGELRLAIYNVDGQFFATSNVCTHQFALLTDGWLDGSVVECPLHAGQFNVKTGEAIGGIVDCPLQTFPVRVQHGIVEIKIP